MSLPWLAGAWLGAGLVASLAGRGPRSRRILALAALALLVILGLLTQEVGATPQPLLEAPPELSREGAGLLVAAPVALALCLLFTATLDGREVLALGAVGAGAAILLGARSPLLLGAAAVIATAALTLRWLAVAPGRATLAAGRVAGTGAAALLASSVFVPSTALGGAGTPAAGMATGLIAAGLVALVALLPLGGWAAGAMAVLAPPEIGLWLLLLAPAALLVAPGAAAALPLTARLALQHTLLVCGLISATWAGLQAARTHPGRRRGRRTDEAIPPATLRYRRLAMGDMALVAAGIGTGQPVGIAGGLLLIVTHLVVAPLLLQPPRAGLELPRRLLWLALIGVPPAPSFWGRFLVLQACAGFGGPVTPFCLIALGVMTLAGVLAITRGEPATGDRAPLLQVVAAWALGAAAVLVAVAPTTVMHAVFGGGA